MMRSPMRPVRAGYPALFALLVGAVPSLAHADVLGRLLTAADDGGGGGGSAAPPGPDDLASWAGPARATTLPDLLVTTVRQAPALATARIDIEIAAARIEQTMSRDDWTLRAQAYGQSAAGFFSGFRIDRSTTVGVTADIGRALPSGGTVTLHVGSEYARVSSPIDSSINTNWSDELNVQLTQPLMRGRGRALYDASERRATLSRDVSVLARRAAAIAAIQTVVSAYWDLVLAERQVAITQASLDLARERLRITQIGTDGGKVPRSEIPAVQQIIATREEDLLSAELAVLERSIVLRRAVGLPIGAGELALRVTPELATRDQAWDLGALTERAYAASPELAQLATQEASTQLDIEVTENGLLPRLDAALTLGPRVQNEQFGSAWRDIARPGAFAIVGSLTYEQALGQENIKGRTRELRASRQRLAMSAVDLRAQIAQTMARAVAQLELARRRVLLSERAIALASENIQVEGDRFNLGKATNFDVLNRQEELRQAELRRSQAMIDGHKAETVVQALTGDLLPGFGITIDDR